MHLKSGVFKMFEAMDTEMIIDFLYIFLYEDKFIEQKNKNLNM